MAEGDEAQLNAADDDFHEPLPGRWFAHETCWFSFFAPEHDGLGGWAYNYIRPNIGISGGGVIVWDDTTWFHMASPYYRSYSAMPLPDERDLRAFTFPSGVSLEAVEPLHRYRFTFDDPQRLTFDLEFTSIMRPWVHAVGHEVDHIDQIGRVTGDLRLHGEDLAIDCFAMRDRSWGRTRSEKWEVGGPAGYTWMSDGDISLLVRGYDEIHTGFLVLDGERAALAGGTRSVVRHPVDGYVTAVEMHGHDVRGRAFHTRASAVSRVAMPLPGVSCVCWTSVLDCELNGTSMWGEDQDLFSLYHWSDYQRRRRSAAAQVPVRS